MAKVELDLDEEQLMALRRRAALDESPIDGVVALAIEYCLMMRDNMEKMPEARAEDWMPLYYGPTATPDALYMKMALRRKV